MAWLTAAEALNALGTRPQTLYANVSRGRIRAKPHPGDPRRSLYNADDIKRLSARKSGRRKTETLASETMRWGEPIFGSAISTVADGRLIYRGSDAVTLADTATLEHIAALLWDQRDINIDFNASSSMPVLSESPLEAAFLALAMRAAADPPSADRSPAALRKEAGSAVASLASALAGTTAAAMHLRLAGHWRRPLAADAIRRALVLLADHELNASTFACRVTVSTGAPLAGGLLAGLAALNGPRHGSASTALFALIDRAEDVGAALAIRDWMALGHRIPAFGHPLYANGDIRAKALLARFDLPPLYAALAAEAEGVLGEQPNVDFALAAMTDAFGLPRTAPLTIFTLARAVGWSAHALEQVESGALIRPRARYTGPLPAER